MFADKTGYRAVAFNLDSGDWDQVIAELPDAHILQTREWGLAKAQFGWRPIARTWLNESGQVSAAALILTRSLGLPGLRSRVRVMYVPKGPALNWENETLRHSVLEDLGFLAAQQNAIFIKIDPDVILGTGIPGYPDAIENQFGQTIKDELLSRRWLFSNDQVQFRNTVIVDLRSSEEEILGRMKQKTRYNIRLAKRKEVSVRLGSINDIDLLNQMYAETSTRDGFIIREPGYYQTIWSTFIQVGLAAPLIAQYQGEPIAAVIVFRFSSRAWYLYGMSRDRHRERMPNYLLQWEAMRWAKGKGCTSYDLWGAPDDFAEGDPLWGVYRFKEGLGGQVLRTIGAWDLPVNPFMYRLYTRILPQVLAMMRSRGKKQTSKRVQSTL